MRITVEHSTVGRYGAAVCLNPHTSELSGRSRFCAQLHSENLADFFITLPTAGWRGYGATRSHMETSIRMQMDQEAAS